MSLKAAFAHYVRNRIPVLVNSFLSFLYFDVFMYTYVRYTWECKYHSQTVCVYGNTYEFVQPTAGSPRCIYAYMCISIYTAR